MKLILNKGQKLWWTSDTHYGHANICSATTTWQEPNRSRKFDSLDDMNTGLVDNINRLVGPDDILFHLGDWSFGGIKNIEIFRNRINCKNIHLVLGNHDYHIERDTDNTRRLFASVNQYLELKVVRDSETYNFVLMHYPISSWNNLSRGVIHLHGHVHLPPESRIASGKCMDVGVEGNGLEPISYDDIISIMKTQPISSSISGDHHYVQK